VFVGGLMSLEMQRIVFDLRGLPIRLDSLRGELGQRVRDVQQGPDGLLHLLVDEEEGALLRIEPVQYSTRYIDPKDLSTFTSRAA
jgi:aldose sugar dehydrogenase